MRKDERTEAEALRLFHEAVELYERDEFPPALPLLQRSLAINVELGDRHAAALIRIYIGQVHMALNNPGAARRELSAAHDMLRDLGDQAGQGQARLELGELAFEMGETGVAQMHFEEAVRLLAGGEEVTGLAEAHTRLGYLAFERDEFELAREEYEEALRLYEQAGDLLGTAGASIELANCLQHVDQARARQLFEVGRDLAQRAGNDYLASVAIHGLGVLHADADEWVDARSQYQTALDLKERIEDRVGQAFTYLALGAAEQALGNISGARAVWRMAAELGREQGLDYLVALAEAEVENSGLVSDWGRD